jgi:hypothetical protein
VSEVKYQKYLIKAPIQPAKKGPPVPSLRFSAVEHGVSANWSLVPVFQPRIMHDIPIKHDFSQFLCFLGSNPADISDLGAEIDISLGEEGEIHTVNTPTVVHVTPDLVHCPINIKKVEKPIFHFDMFFAPEYIYSEVDQTVAKTPLDGHKYSQYIFPAPMALTRPDPPAPAMRFWGPDCGEAATITLTPVSQPWLMECQPHKHDFHQFLCFVGSDPYNIADFDAEIEVWLGEEGEKHTITSPTILHYPPGMVHNPVNYKKVGKPVFQFDIFFAPENLKKSVPGKTQN